MTDLGTVSLGKLIWQKIRCHLSANHEASEEDEDKLFESSSLVLRTECAYCGAPIELTREEDETEDYYVREYYIEWKDW